MAQYDGSIRINTEIQTKQAKINLSTLENRIVKTADKVASLRSKMDSLRDAKIPTQEYQEISNQIAKAESEFNKLLEKQEQMQREGKDNGAAWDRLNAKMEETGNTIRYAKGELQDLVDSGEAFTLGSDTEEFAKLSQQLEYAENDLSVLNQRHELLLLKQQKNADAYKKLGDIAKKSFNAIGNILKKANSLINNFGKRIKEAFTKFSKSASGATKSAKGFSLSLKNILKYGFGIRSLYIAFNKLRSAIKEGFTNLYNDKNITEFKSSVDSLRASILTLKNSFAAAFRPIVEIAIPYIQKLTDYMTQLLETVGQFLAAITGQKKYTKAIKQTADAFKDAKRAADGYLSPLDEINKYQTSKSADADSEASGAMFEEVPLGNSFKDISQWLKDMWESADFTELSAVIGKKIKSALDSIPWENIKKSARKIGSSIATLINGGVEVPGLGYSIGDTLAQTINTGFENLNTFVHKLHWNSVGTFIADSLNGLFGNIDWDLIKNTFVDGVKGLAGSINSFIDDFDWNNISDTISSLVNIVTKSVYEFISTINWEQLGEELGEQLSETAKKIDWEEVGKAIGSVIQAALDFLEEFVKDLDFGEVAQAVVDTLEGFFESVDVGQLASIIVTLLAAEIAIKATASLFAEAGKAILKALGKAILSATSTISVSEIASGILTSIGTAWGSLGGLSGILTTDLGTIMGAGTAAEIGVTIGTGILAGLAAAIGGGAIGQWLDNYILGPIIGFFDEESGDFYKNFKWFGEGGLFDAIITADWKESLKALDEMDTSIRNSKFVQFLTGDLSGLMGKKHKTWDETKAEVSGAITWIKDEVPKIWETFIGKISTIPEWYEKNVKPWFTVEKWAGLFQNVAVSAAQKFIDIKNWWDTNVSPWVSKAWEMLKDSAKAPINGIISMAETLANGVVKAINAVITALNGLSFDIPDWVPGIGGKGIGFNIPELSQVSIPRLATGAVIPANREFLAVLGDQKHGTNIEAPLDTIKQANRESILEVLSELGLTGAMGNGNSQTIIIKQYLDGKQVAESVVKEGKVRQMATGSNMFMLGTT